MEETKAKIIPKIKNNKTKECEDELLIKNYDLVYKFNLVYLFGHITILLEFLILNITTMVFVNLISIGWFSYNAYKMSNSSVERYVETEKRMMIEVLVHQILAFYFVGGQAGFQYILLACACVMFTLYKDEKGKKYYIFKAILMIFVFVLLQLSTYYYTPKVIIDPLFSTIWTILIVTYTFIVSAYFTLKSYTNVIESIEDFKKELFQKNNKLQNIQKEVILSLSNVIESRDENTGEHINRTSKYVQILVSEMKKDKKFSSITKNEFVNNITLAAPMHDIGKIKIPDSILLKPGKLTKEEFEIIKKHTIYGGEIINNTLKNIEDPVYTNMVYNIAMFHHEKWDGTGYPEGLKGEEIPIEARIMALADVYDALTTNRCYKDAFTPEEAYRMMKSDLGKHFDPEIGQIFLNLVKRKYQIED